MRKVLLAFLLSACVANSPAPQPLTWADAEEVWADGWCQYAERCFPTQYHAVFGDQWRCVAQVVHDNYRSVYGYLYPPDRYEILEVCHDDTVELACTSTSTPLSCLEAFF